jgi:surface antigen
VPFARTLSSVAIYGDAWHWWDSAAGRYDRGGVPQAGAVLSFRSNIRMPLGHVAVVTRVLGRRLIEIDHANWSFPGAITRSVEVVDVSDNNDWTSVRVELGKSDWFGGTYATDGFIYGKPVELGPQVIDVAQTLRAAKTPYVIHVAEALQRDNHPQIVDVAEYLRTRHPDPSASLPRGAIVRLTSIGR